nr:MAG TPA: Protein of unknown function (DUF968) [Caudoviricetes sp.]
MSKLDNYYQNCAYPKPRSAKKKKKMNGWKNKPNRVCKYCGKPYAERHEVFGGSNRQISQVESIMNFVCRKHHEELHANCTVWAQRENQRLRQHYQLQYEIELIEQGLTPEQARRDWMLLIGRNYLQEV